MWYGYAADAVVGMHVAYVGYVVVGLLLVIVAAPMKWRWARNPWFRFTHLGAITVVAVEVFMGWECPLTVWEYQLRELAGTPFDGSESFMGRFLHSVLFFPSIPVQIQYAMYIATGAMVVQAFIMYPPRWFRLGKRAVAEPSAEAALAA